MRRALVFCLLLGACSDPVRQSEIDSLGGEVPGVPHGPLHRPGQPCVLCHGGSGPANTVFSLAGTVYQTPSGTIPLADALVKLVDANGNLHEAATNCAGNFFVMQTDFEPVYPVWAKVVFGNVQGAPAHADMGSPIYREGSCATCHGEPAGTQSVGRVYFAPEGTPFPIPECP